MPRIATSKLVGNYFHIIVQGINREYIFEKERYKIYYYDCLHKDSKKYNISILAYVIMDNHTHILLYCKNTSSLSKMMSSINTSFSMFYNKMEHRVGYVFRDRYYRKPILNRKNLLNCMVYIHKNPINAKICENEIDYKYSSYREFVKENFIITKKSKKLLFGTTSKVRYIVQFYNLHKTIYMSSLFEIDDDTDYISLVNELRDRGFSNAQISNTLYYDNQISQRKIAQLLGISRYFVQKYIKSSKNSPKRSVPNGENEISVQDNE